MLYFLNIDRFIGLMSTNQEMAMVIKSKKPEQMAKKFVSIVK